MNRQLAHNVLEAANVLHQKLRRPLHGFGLRHMHQFLARPVGTDHILT